MGEIYSGAKEVVAWLGAGDEATEKAVQFIARWGHDLNSTSVVESNAISTMKRRGHQPKQYLEAYYTIESVPYWSRLWIVQEILLANTLTLLYNHQRMSIACLEYTRQWLDLLGSFSENIPKNLERFYCGLALDERAGSKFSDFGRLVTKFRAHKCTNSLDRVFALRALDPNAQRINVDYSTDKSVVFLQVLQYLKREPLISGFHLMRGLGITVGDIVQRPRSSNRQSWPHCLLNFASLSGGVTNGISSHMNFSAEWSSSDMQFFYPELSIDCGGTHFCVDEEDVSAILDEASLGLLLRRITPLGQSVITTQNFDDSLNEPAYELVALLLINSDDLERFHNQDSLEEQQKSASTIRMTLCNIDLEPGDGQGMVVNVHLRSQDQDIDLSHDLVSSDADHGQTLYEQGSPITSTSTSSYYAGYGFEVDEPNSAMFGYSDYDCALYGQNISLTQSPDDVGYVSEQSYVEAHLSWRILLIMWQMLEKDGSMFKDIHAHETF